jgi:hypothetical protein
LRHFTSSDFWLALSKLPPHVRELAHKNFELLKENPRHPSLQLKRIEDLWAARVGIHHRALGIDADEGIQWIWIGSHAEYDRLIG